MKTFRRLGFSSGWTLALLLAMALLISGCSTGVYPLDVLTEMHYSQAFKAQEPPRLQPPAGSVPITGKEVAHPFSEYKNLKAPGQIATTYSRQRGSDLYRVNCVFCHGTTGKGDGPLRTYLTGFPPADLTGAVAQRSTEGEVFGFISYGGRIGFAVAPAGAPSPSPMPIFNKLLTEEERWILTLYVLRELAGR